MQKGMEKEGKIEEQTRTYVTVRVCRLHMCVCICVYTVCIRMDPKESATAGHVSVSVSFSLSISLSLHACIKRIYTRGRARPRSHGSQGTREYARLLLTLSLAVLNNYGI